MEPIALSGFTLPNRFARIALQSLEDLLKPKGMETLLLTAHLGHLIENYPPANLERGFDFAEFGALNLALEEMYGPRGGRGMALRAGRSLFSQALSRFGALAGMEAMAFRMLPAGRKLWVGLGALARIFSEMSDQHSLLRENRNEFHYIVQRNAICWGRSGEERPVCYMMVGMLQEALLRISGGHEFRVDEAECQASGGQVCRFIIQKEPLS
ncbi:MAG: 4-vinyl reductase [Anaerolineales bacterium]|nr:4-vinyl reductase [Anaerolineales bacterium]